MADARPVDPPWDIRLDGRAWRGGEALARLEAMPEKFEMTEGCLFFDEEQRLTVLAALLENVGLVAAVRLAPTVRWREALEQVDRASRDGP